MSRAIEIEHRARFDKHKYDELLEFLKTNAQDLGQDDKNVYFFLLPDQILKVTDNVSQNSAKITFKSSKIGQGSDFAETEILISRQDVDQAVELFRSLGFKNMTESFQWRHNFLYRGVEIAVKYSERWGYHAEFEVMVSSKDEKTRADNLIRAVAQELGITLMTEAELRQFIAEKEAEINAENPRKN